MNLEADCAPKAQVKDGSECGGALDRGRYREEGRSSGTAAANTLEARRAARARERERERERERARESEVVGQVVSRKLQKRGVKKTKAGTGSTLGQQRRPEDDKVRWVVTDIVEG